VEGEKGECSAGKEGELPWSKRKDGKVINAHGRVTCSCGNTATGVNSYLYHSYGEEVGYLVRLLRVRMKPRMIEPEVWLAECWVVAFYFVGAREVEVNPMKCYLKLTDQDKHWHPQARTGLRGS